MGVAPARQRADQLSVAIEMPVELAPDRERLVQAGRVAERTSHLGEVGRGPDRQAMAHAHVDVTLRLGRAARLSRTESIASDGSPRSIDSRAMLEYRSVQP